MSLREDRMAGRIRRCLLIPTEDMAADHPTKKMVSPTLMNILHHGILIIKRRLKKHVRYRVRAKRHSYTEEDLEEVKG